MLFSAPLQAQWTGEKPAEAKCMFGKAIREAQKNVIVDAKRA